MIGRCRFTYESDTLWHRYDGGTIPASVNPPTELPPLYPGHLAFQVRVGFNAPDEGASALPDYNEMISAIGATGDNVRYLGNVRRLFSSTTTTASELRSMLAKCDARNQLPVITFKVNNEFDQVAMGNRDSWITPIITVAKERRVANGGSGKPFLISFHHEPNGNGPAGMTLIEQLTWWGRMQFYSLNYITGWKTRGYTNVGGTYDANDDVRDIAVWAPIANGFWWGTKFPHDDRIAAAFPPDFINAMNDRGGPILADHYDPTLKNMTISYDSNNYRIESSFVYASNYDRSWRQIEKMCAWARANGVKAVGAGEVGNTNQANYQQNIDIVMANRDVFTIWLAFNNFQNSAWDWRMIPVGWGLTNGLNPTQSGSGWTLPDYGGDPLSAAYITKYKNLVDRSLSETTPF